MFDKKIRLEMSFCAINKTEKELIQDKTKFWASVKGKIVVGAMKTETQRDFPEQSVGFLIKVQAEEKSFPIARFSIWRRLDRPIRIEFYYNLVEVKRWMNSKRKTRSCWTAIELV